MYDDIIDAKYPFDLGHKRMNDYDRAKQFMPFSALVGYKDAVSETARITSDKVVLDEELNIIRKKLSLKPVVSITYFIPDSSKDGGSYKSISGSVKKIDSYRNMIVMMDGLKIFISDIINIFGDIFN